ncbi:hypothetical protein OCT63_20825 [Vibrio sp. RW]|uniref:hypothetical protein n=1 Tax=Vibrio sp. RW TaxID=2998833 RepID=UPI0022CD5B86|nr:hypothetical protein [Vibrio sp. RW]MDA0146659.1 hypothetical protein [Vibrio sp. RW]
MQRYWQLSTDVDVQTDYLFYTQFNIKLPYITKKFDFKVGDYHEWLADNFDLGHVQRLSPVFGLNICRRHCDTEELMCSLTHFGDPRKAEHVFPIQIHLLDKHHNESETYQFTEDLLTELSFDGDGLNELDTLYIYRLDKAIDLIIYFGQYITIIIVPDVVTNRLQETCLPGWPHTLKEHLSPYKTDIPTVWDSYLRRIRQCVSRRLSTTSLEFEITNWCYRQLD